MYLYSILVLPLILHRATLNVERRLKVHIPHVRGEWEEPQKKLPTVDVVFRARLSNASREIIACLASAKLSDSNSVAAASTILFACSLILKGNVLC